MKDKIMVKGYKIIDVKPDEEFKDDYRRSGDSKSVKKMVKHYHKKVRSAVKKEIKEIAFA